MKLLVVNNLYPPVVYGGYELLCAQVVERLRRRGHEVVVLTSWFGAAGLAEVPGVRRLLDLTTPFPRPGEVVTHVDFSLRALDRVARANAAATARLLDEVRPDAVFCWCMSRISLGPVAAAQEAAVPVAWTVNDEHPRQFRFERHPRSPGAVLRALRQWLARPGATLRGLRPFPVAVISKALKRSLLRQDVPLAHAEVIYQGVPLEDLPFAPRGRAAGEPLRLLYAGQLSRVKGVHTVLEAAALLRAAGVDAQLSVAGGGVADYEAELLERAARADLAGRVAFLGRVPHDRMARVYQEHHVLVFASEWEEPFGLSHLEAMACGCAVASTTTGGSAELVRDGSNALAFPPSDAPALARALGRLAGDEALRLRLVEAARRWVEERHSLDVYVEQLEGFLGRTRSPAADRPLPLAWEVAP